MFLQAFGVGAFEEDDDDVYTVDHLSNYHQTLGGDEEDDRFGWTAPKGRQPGKLSAGSYFPYLIRKFS